MGKRSREKEEAGAASDSSSEGSSDSEAELKRVKKSKKEEKKEKKSKKNTKDKKDKKDNLDKDKKNKDKKKKDRKKDKKHKKKDKKKDEHDQKQRKQQQSGGPDFGKAEVSLRMILALFEDARDSVLHVLYMLDQGEAVVTTGIHDRSMRELLEGVFGALRLSKASAGGFEKPASMKKQSLVAAFPWIEAGRSSGGAGGASSSAAAAAGATAAVTLLDDDDESDSDAGPLPEGLGGARAPTLSAVKESQERAAVQRLAAKAKAGAAGGKRSREAWMTEPSEASSSAASISMQQRNRSFASNPADVARLEANSAGKMGSFAETAQDKEIRDKLINGTTRGKSLMRQHEEAEESAKGQLEVEGSGGKRQKRKPFSWNRERDMAAGSVDSSRSLRGEEALSSRFAQATASRRFL